MMGGKCKSRFYKIFTLLFLTGSLLLVPVLSHAQLPCGGDDPYEECPLDNWVWVLAVIALVAGAVYLYRQQKPQTKA